MQPWAHLVVIGAKKIETRSWNTPFKGPLLIHPSLNKYYGPDKISCRELCYKDPFKKYINGGLAYDKLPLGAIVGKVNIRTTGILCPPYGAEHRNEGIFFNEWGAKFTEEELAFGDYSAGRYGWLLSNPERFIDPIPCKGKQGFWNYDQDLPHPLFIHPKTDWADSKPSFDY